MAPIKFEEKLKEKLEKRTIPPSEDAWNLLANRLDTQDKKQNKSMFWWLGIAASLVGVLLVTSLIFNNEKQEAIKPTLVETPVSDDIQTPNKINALEENAIVSEDITKSKDIVNDTDNGLKQKEFKTVISHTNDVAVNNQKPSLNTESKLSLPETVVVLNNFKESSLSVSEFENAKVDAVVNEINRIKSENSEITETEIDALLKQAEKEILTNRIYNEKTRTVDANALLQDVEADLEQSFRTRVFEALKSNYETVKTAVAERNN
ncbi:hypothetical protein OE09_2512 [Flavobacteriaceae bacterium MAR_2010_72]|nr:hypothetical protein OE09_2512 [Flavobacteriaceae bacterium MAR_2010_72]